MESFKQTIKLIFFNFLTPIEGKHLDHNTLDTSCIVFDVFLKS